MEKQDIFNLIVQHTYEIIPELKEHNFQPADRLKDLGANSMDRAEIVMMTMETLSLQIPRVELMGAQNIGELTEIFYGKLQAV
jgi:polyketide biosynthesis acyl carrier protein